MNPEKLFKMATLNSIDYECKKAAINNRTLPDGCA